MKIAIDSSVLVGFINPRDHWHLLALSLMQRLHTAGYEFVYFDCVAAESISVVLRRLEEKNNTQSTRKFLENWHNQIPDSMLEWVFPDVPRLYPEILEVMRASGGALNFNDALIALACRERQIDCIASFDTDFDTLNWLRRVAAPEELGA